MSFCNVALCSSALAAECRVPGPGCYVCFNSGYPQNPMPIRSLQGFWLLEALHELQDKGFRKQALNRKPTAAQGV